jgi:hypothetical protein
LEPDYCLGAQGGATVSRHPVMISDVRDGMANAKEVHDQAGKIRFSQQR